MSGMESRVRDITDELDALGNTTAAIGKGFAVGSAAMTAVAFFSAYVKAVGLDTLELTTNTMTGLMLGAVVPFAVAALQSLTDEAVTRTDRLLLTATARAENTGMSFNLARDKILQNGGAPIIAEPVVGTVTFKTSRDSVTMYPIKVDGTRSAAVRIPVRGGTATVELKAAYKTIFYEIEAR